MSHSYPLWMTFSDRSGNAYQIVKLLPEVQGTPWYEVRDFQRTYPVDELSLKRMRDEGDSRDDEDILLPPGSPPTRAENDRARLLVLLRHLTYLAESRQPLPREFISEVDDLFYNYEGIFPAKE